MCNAKYKNKHHNRTPICWSDYVVPRIEALRATILLECLQSIVVYVQVTSLGILFDSGTLSLTVSVMLLCTSINVDVIVRHRSNYGMIDHRNTSVSDRWPRDKDVSWSTSGTIVLNRSFASAKESQPPAAEDGMDKTCIECIGSASRLVWISAPCVSRFMTGVSSYMILAVSRRSIQVSTTTHTY